MCVVLPLPGCQPIVASRCRVVVQRAVPGFCQWSCGDARSAGACLPRAITEIHCTIVKPAFVQKIELDSHVIR